MERPSRSFSFGRFRPRSRSCFTVITHLPVYGAFALQFVDLIRRLTALSVPLVPITLCLGVHCPYQPGERSSLRPFRNVSTVSPFPYRFCLPHINDAPHGRWKGLHRFIPGSLFCDNPLGHIGSHHTYPSSNSSAFECCSVRYMTHL